MARQIEALATTPELLRLLLRGTTARDLGWKPASDRWSASEVLGHLVDVERAFCGQSSRIVEEQHPLLEVYDPTAESTKGIDFERGERQQLSRFLEARRRSVQWLQTLPGHVWQRTGEHPKTGAVRLEQVVHLWAFHDLGHLRQLAEVVRAVRHWEGLGSLQRFYRINP